MVDSRTKNTVRNIGAGLINQVVSIILPFINRTIILWSLGVEFTGLSGLFSSILSVLGIAELGFNTAIVYSLYRPMSEHDENKICEIVSLFQKIYGIIGTIVLVLGMAIMPFLKYLICLYFLPSISKSKISILSPLKTKGSLFPLIVMLTSILFSFLLK